MIHCLCPSCEGREPWADVHEYLLAHDGATSVSFVLYSRDRHPSNGRPK